MDTININHKQENISLPLEIENDPAALARPASPKHSLVILDRRELDRHCLAQCMTAHTADFQILAFGSIEEWKQKREEYPPLSAILLNVGGKMVDEPAVSEQIKSLSSEFASTPVIILSDSDDFAQIVRAIDCGAKGYIPASVSISVCMELIALSVAGGLFVPASALFAMRHLLQSSSSTAQPLAGIFTDRQAEVVAALRRGKANKIIAYELNLRESTVKVHVRNIMKKVKATNRTEVVFKLNDLFQNNLSGGSTASSLC
ncbi:LuxR family transcriptional regulator protein (plasmid) [Rhizobium phaseoli]|uniref:LuxR family transcriptional regulator protein n=1 Tax=Rhizobium phaseoli TaxID=396 RepID=A0ABM6CJP5_9HYPH|nr:response regulator transcription factor [Rhizobium phaseoli]KEC70358.1 LuxR family transcriptional regulator [Rhizobium leguminosarum bv. phaseoli CCGM1]ANL31293.1 LuxR family transcriptional regulator protein [Rhizobium phaseoli]ANL37747.1 LuxR family transcriptional regulator protein [Rhizobium phaseoli]ANL56745.1 LuxR family transcriptional regulator protein [Rhizobium phaseoli]ANL88519.1 LuxR family transcriptional regulator protein [Rhizobium phaseoli]